MKEDPLQRMTSSKSEHVFYLNRRQSRLILLYLIILSMTGIVSACLALCVYYSSGSDNSLPSLVLIALFSIPSSLLGSSLQFIHMLYLMYFDVQLSSDDDTLSDNAKEWANRGSLIYFFTRPPVFTIICFFLCIVFSKGLTGVLTKDQSISDSGYITIMTAAFLLSFAGGKVFERIVDLGISLTEKISIDENEPKEEEQGEIVSEEDGEEAEDIEHIL